MYIYFSKIIITRNFFICNLFISKQYLIVKINYMFFFYQKIEYYFFVINIFNIKKIIFIYMEDVIVCIPARYASSRLPGKPLLKINNKTILEHVYLNALKINDIKNDNIIILTDDNRIYKEVVKFGGNCYISKQSCSNGSIRILNYLKETKIDKKFILNIQGDEPFFDVKTLEKLILDYKKYYHNNSHIKCGTLYYNIQDNNYVQSKNKVKLIINQKNFINYGSRNVIPALKNVDDMDKIKIDYHIHIGIFIFERKYLLEEYKFGTSSIQELEDLEWLKIIDQDYKIYACETKFHEVGVDTIEDYEYLKNKYEDK